MSKAHFFSVFDKAWTKASDKKHIGGAGPVPRTQMQLIIIFWFRNALMKQLKSRRSMLFHLVMSKKIRFYDGFCNVGTDIN